jgi:amino acid adenylation domain-containing protein/FkbM family methyltransferase
METSHIAGFRLSPQQGRVYLLQEALEQPRYVQGIARVIGAIDIELLEAAISAVVRRHEMLRTTFHTLPDIVLPIQVIAEDANTPIIRLDLRHLQAEAQDNAIADVLHAARVTPFDWRHGPLVTFWLVTQPDQRVTLLIHASALCADQTALSTILDDISQSYTELLYRRIPRDTPMQYADLAEWYNETLASEDLNAARSYWGRQPVTETRAVRMPFERRLHSAEYKLSAHARTLDPSLRHALTQFAEEHNIPINTILLACWRVLLWQFSRQPNLMVSVYDPGRQYEDVQDVIGPVGSYVPVMLPLTSELTFSALLEQAQSAYEEAVAFHEQLPWYRAMESAGEPSNVFVPFGFDYEEQTDMRMTADVSLALVQTYSSTDHFRLRLACRRNSTDDTLTLYYNRSEIADSDAKRLLTGIEAMLRQALAAPTTPIADLHPAPLTERRTLLERNQPPASGAAPVCFHHLFDAQVRRSPDATAVVYEHQQLTYAELDVRANQLAHYLQRRGAGRDSRVAICLERSIDVIVAMLATLKAGAAYVPIDPALPEARQAFLLQSTDARVLITHGQSGAYLHTYVHSIVTLDNDAAGIAQCPTTAPDSNVTPENLAYVLFTSGSTGKPKGVAIEHRQLVSYVRSIIERLALPDQASYATVSTFAADLGNTVLFPPLCSGGCLHIIAQERITDADALADYFRQTPIDCLKIVPSHLQALLDAADPAAVLPRSVLVLGGEAARWNLVDHVRSLAPMCRILNHYGPTETTVGVLTYPIDTDEAREYAAVAPIGRPLDSARVYVLDKRFQPAPIWATGEMYIGGASVARGYIGMPGLTAERFIPDLFSPCPGARMYRTGDLARLHPNGVIEFLGRADHQVKVRGFRIEPAEIEAAIREYPGAQDAVVTVRETRPDHHELVAYVVSTDAARRATTRQRRYRLPGDIEIAHLNKHETDFFYDQIFVHHVDFQNGITLHEDDVVFDVGANIGLFTLFTQHQWQRVRVFAFEPIPPIFDVLCANTLPYAPHVSVFRRGLSRAVGEATFTYYPHSSCQSGCYADVAEDMAMLKTIMSTQQEIVAAQHTFAGHIDDLLAARSQHESFTCPLTTVSAMLAALDLERIDLLKIDAEKSEADVLAGIRDEDWPKIRQIVVEAHDLDGSLAQLTSNLRQRGYTVAVEQNSAIRETNLYNVYATRMMPDSRPHRPTKSLPDDRSESNGGIVVSGGELRQFLRQRLPDYMLPTTVVPLTALPLTSNGKIDRQALPDPDQAPAHLNTYVPPQSPVEMILAQIWGDLLNLDRISVTDNFFDIGGHSLLATQLIAQVRRVFQVDLSLRAVFDDPILQTMARRLIAAEQRPGQTEKIAELLLKIKQTATIQNDDVSQSSSQE